MRRSAPTGSLSPKLIKHFAMTTVALTGLLALFASGADWAPQAQVGAVTAKNQLLTVEAEQLGARRLAAKLKVMPGPSRQGFDEDPGFDFGDRGSDNAALSGPSQPFRPSGDHNALSPGLASPPGAVAAVTGASSLTGNPQSAKAKTRGSSAPTAQEIASITASSARRSGSSGETD